MDEIKDISLNIYFLQGNKTNIKLPSSAIVEDLKLEIHKQFSIRPSKQIITGWSNVPENDDSPIESCIYTKSSSNLLVMNSEQKMELQEKPCFFVLNGDYENIIELYEYDSVETLKVDIHEKFKIPLHKQVLSGWKIAPECDNTILQICANTNTVNYLKVMETEEQDHVNGNGNFWLKDDTDLELAATSNFVKKISRTYEVDLSIFCTCSLSNAISEACFAPLEKRKIVLLYLHSGNDKFASIFMNNLKKPTVIETLKRNFFILGWDVEETNYRNALLNALQNCSDLSNVGEVINCNFSTALCIVPVRESLTTFSCLKGNISDKNFLTSLENAEKFLIVEKQQEHNLEELEEKTGNKDDFGSVNYQQLMADMLGDRDYDGFEYNQHDLLKKKIAFALLGQPQTETGEGYDIKDMKRVEHLFEVILCHNNLIAEYKDKIEISFIYNCTEPLPIEKIKRAEKYPDYNPKTDLMPVPIFVIRKCQGSEDPCRIFIDHIGRTYKTWNEYKNRNKLHECVMVLPQNGRYDVDCNGKVILERQLSPACGIDVKILQAADYVSIAGGLISGGIFVAAAIPAITVAPAALIAGGITGISVGVYSIARSAYTLYDRSRHNETLSFADSEARGAYINIIAGALGFVGAGANVVVTQLAARGVNIGRGATAVVDTITIVNIGASGIGVINSGYDVFDKWFTDKQTPSLLTVLQLSSSILFFGNAVYNFRSCSTIIEETQVRTLENYQDSLRSNRHRKTFTKVLKETIRQNDNNHVQGRAEVIAAIRNIQNKDEVFAVLTRSNRELNRKGIKISASGGDIVLNGVKIDYNEFSTMNKKEATSFLSNLPRSDPTPIEAASTRSMVSNILRDFSCSDIESVTNVALKLLSFCSGDIKDKIIGALASLLAKLTFSVKDYLDELFPNHTKFGPLINMVVSFFAQEAENLEKQYQEWTETGDINLYNPIFQSVDVKKVNRTITFFEQAVNLYYSGTYIIESELTKLITYFYNWFADVIFKHEEDATRAVKRRIHSASSPSTTLTCEECKGYYYERIK